MGRAVTLSGQAALVMAGLAYVAVLVLRLPAFIKDIVPTSDTISPVLLVEALTVPRHGMVYLGSHAGYNDLVLASAGLPFHLLRDVPEALPYAAYILGVLLLIVAVRRLTGWPGALLTLAAAIGSAPVTLLNEMSPAGRVLTLTNICLLGLVLVVLLLPARPERRRWSRLVPGIILLGLVTGFDTASDPLLGIVGLLPFVGTGLALWATGRREPASTVAVRVAGGVAVVSVVGYVLTDRLAAALFHLSYNPPPIHLASIRTVDYNLHLLGGDVRVAMGGTWSYVSNNAVGTLEAVIGLLLGLVSVAVVVGALRMVRRSRQQGGRERARAGWALFWGLVLLTDIAAYLATDFPTSLWTIRYLTPAWLALAALISLVPGRSRSLRLATMLATATLVGANAWSLAVLVPGPPQPVTAVLQTLEKHHLTQGYADYSKANLVTWQTRGRVTLRQVVECGPDHARLCAYRVNAADAWFRPLSGPIAVVVDPAFSVNLPPSPAYGGSQAVIHVGAIAIYVYDRKLTLDPP
jgi:hypothetical protein